MGAKEILSKYSHVATVPKSHRVHKHGTKNLRYCQRSSVRVFELRYLVALCIATPNSSTYVVVQFDILRMTILEFPAKLVLKRVSIG